MSVLAVSILLGLGFFFLLHIAIWRALPSVHPRMLLLALLAVGGLIVSALLEIAWAGWDRLALWGLMWVEIFLFLFYFFTYAGLIRSVSITLLSRLLVSPRGRERFEVLAQEYDASERFEDRLRVMAASGLIEMNGPLVTLTPKGTRWARWTKRLSQMAGVGLRG